MTRWRGARQRRQAGQGLAEYALILALIALLVMGALLFLGNTINDFLSELGQTLNSF